MAQNLQYLNKKHNLYDKVSASIQLAQTDQDRANLYFVLTLLTGRETVTAASFSKPVQRYNLLPGKTFASGPKAKDKYKILNLSGDDIVYQNLNSKKVDRRNVNHLVKEWQDKRYKEITFFDNILDTVRGVLGPVLGAFLTTALIVWLTEKLS